jgi:hypothetical protein
MPAVDVLEQPGARVKRKVAKRRQPADEAGGEEKPRSAGRPSIGRQINVRLPDDLLADLEFVCEALGLDLSNVVRMMLTEQRHVYLLRAREARQKLEEARKEQEGSG